MKINVNKYNVSVWALKNHLHYRLFKTFKDLQLQEGRWNEGMKVKTNRVKPFPEYTEW